MRCHGDVLTSPPQRASHRDTATQLGVKLSGPWMPCVASSKAKARHNAVPKSTDTRSTTRAGRFFLPVSLVLSLRLIFLHGPRRQYAHDEFRWQYERYDMCGRLLALQDHLIIKEERCPHRAQKHHHRVLHHPCWLNDRLCLVASALG